MFKTEIDEGEDQNCHCRNNVKLTHLQDCGDAQNYKTTSSHIFKKRISSSLLLRFAEMVLMQFSLYAQVKLLSEFISVRSSTTFQFASIRNVGLRGLEMSVFREILRRYLMYEPNLQITNQLEYSKILGIESL